MSLEVIITEAADADIREIFDFIVENSSFEARAEQIIEEIYYRAELLADFPFIGRNYENIFEGARIFPIRDLASIIYIATENKIEILRIFYKGRDF